MLRPDFGISTYSVQDAIGRLVRWSDVDYATFHLIVGSRDELDNPFVRTTYPSDWVSHYLLNNFVRLDPVLAHARRVDDPFFWDEVEMTAAQSVVLKAAIEHGIGVEGYTLPFKDAQGRRSVLTLNRSPREGSDWRAHVETIKDDLQGLARDLHLKSIGEAFIESGSGLALSPREGECLKWTAQGKSYSEIATILDLSEHTVRNYLKDARLKLDSVSLAQAVCRAVREGLL